MLRSYAVCALFGGLLLQTVPSLWPPGSSTKAAWTLEDQQNTVNYMEHVAILYPILNENTLQGKYAACCTQDTRLDGPQTCLQ